MDLGTCWQSDVWADGSWVEGVWCPESPCIPVSIGECWEVVWCSGAWQSGVWCPSSPVPPAPVIVVDDRRWPGPPITIYRDVGIASLQKRRKEDEELIIL